MGQQEYDDMWAAAEAYNQSLAENPDRFTMSREEKERYKGLLDISDTGMMGYLDIPSIHVSMPIYHTTEEGILQVAAGHLEGSSLPTGEPGHIVCCLVTEDCQAPGSLQIWIKWRREKCSLSVS